MNIALSTFFKDKTFISRSRIKRRFSNLLLALPKINLSFGEEILFFAAHKTAVSQFKLEFSNLLLILLNRLLEEIFSQLFSSIWLQTHIIGCRRFKTF